MDSEYNFYVNNPYYFYNSNVSYSYANGKPIATISRGGSAFFQFEGSSLDIVFQKFEKTGNAKIYIDGNLYDTFSIGTSLSYTDSLFSVSGLSDTMHTLQIVSQGNTVIDADSGRNTTSNIVISSVKGISSIDKNKDFQNFSFLFCSLLLLSVVFLSIVNIFRGGH